MRRRTSSGAGSRARAGMLALEKELRDTYPQFPQLWQGIDNLDSGREIAPIPGWAISAWVPGVDPYAMYRLGTDDSVIEL